MHSHRSPRAVSLMFRSAAVLLVLAAGAAGAWGAAAKTLVVQAGPRDRELVPMSVALPDKADKARLADAGRPVPCQVVDGRLWWVLDKLPAGASRNYTVELGATPPAAEAGKGVELAKSAEHVAFTIDGQPFTTYAFQPGRQGKNLLRRPYFFPVYGPGQTAMTRPFPMVHEGLPANVATDPPHHTTIWVAHGEVNGVDDWSIAAKAGRQVHKDFPLMVGGPVVGVFRETLDWTDADRKPVLAETRTVRAYRLPDSSRMLDLELTFRAAYGKVVFGDTKEGGLCATRMRPEFRADKRGANGRLVNSEGQAGDAAWGKPAKWVDCSGEVDGKRLGYAIFDTPGNPRYPTTWHARTYGLLTANPFGLKSFDRKSPKGDFTIEADKECTFRYRIYFHAGDEKSADVAGRFADYAEPPAAAWK